MVDKPNHHHKQTKPKKSQKKESGVLFCYPAPPAIMSFAGLKYKVLLSSKYISSPLYG